MQAQPALANEGRDLGVEVFDRENSAEVFRHGGPATVALGPAMSDDKKSLE
ncbi:hypothetical protein PF002_g21597 [Phytophthora fragariae]|uniref:Uncharacterized protein n=1 Tax=Phytophthora fragariae TaxID=53985 RepID=A0A6A3XEI3_9STRA|nr:hypothetical protein PF003_g6793 [Phytophthora fragariae]KAE9056060.1 hypothetical protein PF007_g32109 [Phytophthora fragariae]KAE9157788.1 hypothetical protein PF004_g32090 [Phytophthora fragariae]KAE9201238.1 hypothetical protein PF002_g21597 [Phytophthora fragariae]